MIVKPLSDRAGLVLLAPVLIPLLVVCAPIGLLLWAEWRIEKWIKAKLNPPGWRRHFAWRPVECDPWPHDGFRGWVWLETVWRNPVAPGWTHYRREPWPNEAVLATPATDAA